MATSDDDNDVNGDGTTSNEVDDDSDGVMGDEASNDDDDGDGNDDGDGDGAMGSGATGYDDDDDGRTIAAKRRHAVGRCRPMPPPNDDTRLPVFGWQLCKNSLIGGHVRPCCISFSLFFCN